MRAVISGVLLILMVVPLAQAITYDLEAREDSQGASYFAFPGDDAHNPMLGAAPGETLTIRFTNAGQLRHNLQLGAPLDVGTSCCQGHGESAILTVVVPANLSGDVVYHDVLHAGAAGVLRVGPPIPTVRIVMPQGGENVLRRVTMQVSVGNFTIGADGLLQYSIDSGLFTRDVNSTDYFHEFVGLGNGAHLLSVELVNTTGHPLEPRVRDDVVVYVSPTATEGPTQTPEPPSATPTGMGLDEDKVAASGLLLALVAVFASAAILRLRR